MPGDRSEGHTLYHLQTGQIADDAFRLRRQRTFHAFNLKLHPVAGMLDVFSENPIDHIRLRTDGKNAGGGDDLFPFIGNSELHDRIKGFIISKQAKVQLPYSLRASISV